MPRGPCAFKQSDITKAVRAVVAAGIEVARVEVDKAGKIIVVVGDAEQTAPASNGERNEWDT